MTRAKSDERLTIADYRRLANDESALAEMRSDASARIARYEEHLKDPGAAIDFLMHRVERLRLALGFIAYLGRGDLTPDQMVLELQRTARKAGEWPDPVDGERLLEVVR